MKQMYLQMVRVWRGILFLFIFSLFFMSVTKGQQSQGSLEDFSIDVNINQTVGEMYPMWAFFGYDEPNYTYMADGRKLISELAELSPVPVYFRAHHMLTTDEGPRAALKWGSTNAYTEDEQGNPVYDWTIVDKIFDTYIDNGGKPLVEIGFTPKALSPQPEPYRHHWSPEPNSQGDLSNSIATGVHYPPNDYEKWSELVYQWVLHSIDRYGKEEVESWWWESYNHPYGGFWQGTTEEFIELYDYSSEAVKRALPTARMGGPQVNVKATKGGAEILKTFLDHMVDGNNYATGKKGSQIDYITLHAKGSPKVIGDGQYVQMDMGRELECVTEAFEIVSSYPTLKNLPIIFTEVDPEGCAACPVEFFPQNDYRNGTLYSSYTASSFARIYELADQYDMNLEGILSWSFVFEDQPWFAGFRTLATNGVDKPVLNVFRMFGMMGGDRIEVSQTGHFTAQDIMERGVHGEKPDVHALASRQDNEAMVMVWNYHDNDLPAPDADVTVNITGIPAGRALVRHYRIDDDHSNAYTVWREMGAPQQVTRDQYKKLEDSGQLELLTSPKWVDVAGDKAAIEFSLPRQGVSLLQVTW
jgi:xylan 1,4-beta-xylosidase